MEQILSYFLLIVGFVLLIKGADYFVEGCSSIAKLLNVSSVIIGLTIVAFGTSAPEAAVSIAAGIEGSNEIAVGNIIGSNIFNILMVLGISALFTPLVANKDIAKRDFPIGILLTIILFCMIFNGEISRIEGALLLGLIILYVVALVISARKNRTNDDSIKTLSITRSIVYAILGLIAVIFGGRIIVDNATNIAMFWGVSKSVIALTVIAIGTSLPELVTSVVASKKGEYGLALGNVVGSCIFNIAFILGVSSIISPITIISTETFSTIIDCAVALLSIVLAYIFSKSGKKINKYEGMFFVLLYIGYTVYLILR